MAVPISPLERLRRIWTPGREIEELVYNLDPRTELDSMVRDFLHRTVQQRGAVTLVIEQHGTPVLNTGHLRWEIVHHEPTPGQLGRREITIWIEDEG